MKKRTLNEIERVAAEAKKCGMSYGAYVAKLYCDEHKLIKRNVKLTEDSL